MESELTAKQQYNEIKQLEARFKSYGRLVYGYDDPDLTEFQRRYCLEALITGEQTHDAELKAQHGAGYSLELLARRMDYDADKSDIPNGLDEQ